MNLHSTATPLDEWLDYLRSRNRSPATLSTYQSVMSAYLPDPLTVTLDEAESWWRSIEGQSVRSRARALSVVRSFYKWAIRYDLIERDPTRRLDAPSLPKGAPRYLTRAQVDRLMGELPDDLRRGLALGCYAGLRAAEAAALNWSDVDVEARRLHIVGKGSKSRYVPAHPILLDHLLPSTGGNVVTGGGITYSAGAFQRRINRAIQRAGIEATFHQARHRFGTMAYGGTGDPLAVAAAMGHASLETTRIYAAVSDDALDKVAAAAVR